MTSDLMTKDNFDDEIAYRQKDLVAGMTKSIKGHIVGYFNELVVFKYYICSQFIYYFFLDSHLEDMDADHSHYKPEAIDTLCQLTKFNKRELQLMYRGFKQECPNGMVKEETFKGIYAQYFPKGAETAQYAHYVFNSFDHDNTGAITFTDFVIGLSVLARGSLQEKLRWAFSLYDINGDGYITKDEMSRIVQSIYELMGKAVEPMIEDHTTRDHVDRVFQKLDLNKDGVVTIEEFLDSCQRDENITRNMQVFNTIL
nr:Kv channel-interacting protein 1 [Parasteatoda tepidariorum]